MPRDNETGEFIAWSYDKETGEHFSTRKTFKVPREFLKETSENERKNEMLSCKDDVIYFILITTILFTCPAWGSLLWFVIEYTTHQCDSDAIFYKSCPGASMFFCSRCRIRHHGNIISRMKDRELSRRSRYAALCATS